MLCRFIIPQGIDFDFVVKVRDNNSFLPRNLSTLASAKIDIVDKETLDVVASIGLSIKDIEGGLLQGVIPASLSSQLMAKRGPKEDRFYLIPGYQANLRITFNDGSPSVNALVNRVYVAPTGE